jgi:hypothetical protein
MRDESSLWSTSDRSRWFLIKGSVTAPPGSTPIRSLSGESALVGLDWLTPFEVTEEQARRWAKDQLGQTLEELKLRIDEKLAEWRHQLDEVNRTPVTDETTVTPNAISALLELLKQIPSVLGNSLSGDEQRIGNAKDAMISLQKQLEEAGIRLNERFTNFPDRLAELRKDFEQRRTSKPSNSDES